MKLSASFLLACAAASALAADPTAPNPASTPSTTATTPKPGKTAKKRQVKVKIAMRDGMRFEPPRFTANPGDEVSVSLENADSTHQPHNFLVLLPGKREEVVKQSLELGDKGPAQEFIPVNPAIIAHSALLNPEVAKTIHFTMPPEPGIYPFICSMPGHGMIMYGAIYSGVKMPTLAEDQNIPATATQVATPGGGRRPFVQRIFMPNSGPASIAVALPGDLNYCWDASQCRLRYSWRGPFIDASAHWLGNGRELASVPKAPWWSAEKEKFPIKIPDAGASPVVKFLGYKIDAGLPEFHYEVGDAEVFEKITPAPGDTGLVLHFRIPKLAHSLEFSLAPGNAKLSSSAGQFESGILRIIPGQALVDSGGLLLHPPSPPVDFTVTLTDPSPR
jgi:plastocyanin